MFRSQASALGPRTQLRPPLAPLVIFLASLLLAGLLAVISWRNYQREGELRVRFLHQQGLTLIRSLEAGARTGMRMRWREDALETLIEETQHEAGVTYIAILDEQGVVMASAGSWGEAALPLQAALTAEQLHVRTGSDGAPIFEVSRQFRPRWRGRRMAMMRPSRGLPPGSRADDGPPSVVQAIFVGLDSTEFEQFRRDSLRQNLLQGGLLLLFGTAGFFLLLLLQRNRSNRATLERMEDYAASLIEGMPAGLLSLDAAQRVVAINSQTLAMLELERQQVMGRSLGELAGDEALQQKMTAGCDFIEQPADWLTATGAPLSLRISGSRLLDTQGSLLGTVLILRDMREFQAMEEQLERSRRHSALGVMATGVAHEIRNPLGTLRGFAQYFQRSSTDEKTVEYAGLMVSEVDRLNRVISSLLQFARPRDAEQTPFLSQRLCERVEALMIDEARARDIELQIDCRAAPQTLQGDFDQLLQLLLNLLQNGLEASSAGGRVLLQIERLDRMVEIRVSDQGSGLARGTQGAIFDPFFTTRKNGTGLGLAIVSQIVEQHGGEIGVESLPQQGTTVRVRLPYSEPGG